MTATLCEVEGLSVSYNRFEAGYALSGIDLTINHADRVAIIGESGSGKSTLARALAGLLPHSARKRGSISWSEASGDGGDRTFPVAGRDIGYVFQDPGISLNPVLTVGEQVAEGARFHLGLTWHEALAHARDLLERVQLPHPSTLLKVYPHQLSGGQRQRVAIAAAIAARPKLLIADEATSALDTVSQKSIVELLETLVQEQGMTLIFITHDIALASSLAGRIVVLQSGRLVEQGATAALLRNPKDPYTRELLASHVDLSTPPLVHRVPL